MSKIKIMADFIQSSDYYYNIAMASQIDIKIQLNAIEFRICCERKINVIRISMPIENIFELIRLLNDSIPSMFNLKKLSIDANIEINSYWHLLTNTNSICYLGISDLNNIPCDEFISKMEHLHIINPINIDDLLSWKINLSSLKSIKLSFIQTTISWNKFVELIDKFKRIIFWKINGFEFDWITEPHIRQPRSKNIINQLRLKFGDDESRYPLMHYLESCHIKHLSRNEREQTSFSY